jgi:PST family polysaccharide transporter
MKGVAWTLSGRGLILLAHFGGTIILARLLEPEDFGVYGIALIFSGLATRFGNLGFGLALIQKKEIHAGHISSLFTVNLGIFWCIAGMLFLCSSAVGKVFDLSLVGDVLKVLSFTFLFTPFSSVARAIMQRKMDFKGTSVADLSDHVTAVLVALALAYLGYGVWSLVGALVSGSLVSTLVLLYFSGWKPIPKYDHNAMKDLYSFGIGMFFKNLITYSSDKVDYFIIGLQLGPAAVGFYEKAFNLMEIGVKELGNKVSPVLFSAFSKMDNDAERIKKAYGKILLTMSIVIFPIFFGLCVVAGPFITVVYGSKWIPCVLPLQILCLAGIMRMELRVASTVLNAMGQVSFEVRRRGIALVLLAAGCSLGSQWGIIGVALAVTIVISMMTVSIIGFMVQQLQVSWGDVVGPQLPALYGSFFMVGIVLILQGLLEGFIPQYSIAMLFTNIGIGALSYAGFFYLFNRETIQLVQNEFPGLLGPLQKKAS